MDDVLYPDSFSKPHCPLLLFPHENTSFLSFIQTECSHPEEITFIFWFFNLKIKRGKERKSDAALQSSNLLYARNSRRF